MDFFTGKTVLKTTFEEKVSALERAETRIKEFEASAVDPVPLNERITALEKEVKGHLQTITTLTENYQTAARQAQDQITKAGAKAPVALPNADDSRGAPTTTFSDRVSKKVAAGKGKATAIAECIKEFPTEYAEWLKGDTSKI